MLTLNDGRTELWQWDTGRTLAVDADCQQVHFSNKVFGRSIDVDVIDGVSIIPDILLQTDKDLNAWAFVGTAENGYTKISKTFKVNRRNKPADYVFTPPDQTSLEEIKERIDALEEKQDPDAIKNAVDDYLANNPIMVKETDPTVPEWAKQPTPPDVKIPDKLPNPHSITFTGAVDASYDGSNPVEIKIPDSGGNVDLTGYATEQYVKDYAQPKGDYLTEVPEGYAKTEDIPTKVSELDNDSGYLTEHQSLKGYAKTEDIPTKPEDIGAQPSGNYLTEVPSGYATEEFVKNKIAEAELGGEEVDLSGYAQKSELPTKVSQLQNDSGYLTAVPDGYAKTEDIPKNPADIGAQPEGDYALRSEIPSVPVKSVNGKTGAVSLTATDVKARPDSWMPTASDVGALPNTTKIPSKISDLVNDSGYITGYTETDPTVPAWAKQSTKPSYSKSEVGLGNVANERQYSANNPPPYPVTSVNGKTGAVIIEADKFDPTVYDIPILYLTGDTAGMSKDVAVTLNWVYGENSGSCTLKWQGNSSLAYDKKNYTIKLDNAIDIGYGTQKKYVLKANYIDFSHARNIVSARIWGMMVASRKNIIGKLASSPNYGAVNGFPVAIMLNGKFHGLYTFNIPKDGWMMNMGSGTQECILCADHSTATQFKGEATLVGETDFEVEYITDENNTAWAKTSVNRLINSCINSNGGDLDTTVAQYLDWESAIDYYILVALVDGHDMTDKNYLLSTYDGTKWFFGAYDMDSTYGLKWDGSYFSKASYGDHTSFVNYANTHRVMELIKRFKTNALKARYAELRADVLSESTIAREFERFACSIPSRLLDEDRNVWPMLPCTSVNNTFQILCWLDRRLEYVDKWMEELPAQETPAGPSYTNLVPTATDESGAVYNGTGYKDGYRLSSVSTNPVEKAAEHSTLTGYIPISAATDIVRVKGVELLASTATNGAFHCYFVLYDSAKKVKGYSTVDNFNSGSTGVYDLSYDAATGVYTIGVSKMAGSYPGYFRLNAQGKGADLIVTVNEEIK